MFSMFLSNNIFLWWKFLIYPTRFVSDFVCSLLWQWPRPLPLHYVRLHMMLGFMQPRRGCWQGAHSSGSARWGPARWNKPLVWNPDCSSDRWNFKAEKVAFHRSRRWRKKDWRACRSAYCRFCQSEARRRRRKRIFWRWRRGPSWRSSN